MNGRLSERGLQVVVGVGSVVVGVVVLLLLDRRNRSPGCLFDAAIRAGGRLGGETEVVADPVGGVGDVLAPRT